jgi:hypothetical protein
MTFSLTRSNLNRQSALYNLIMEFNEYKSLVKTLPLGKKLPDSVYIHVSAISHIPTELMTITIALADKFNIDDDQWNIIKFNNRDFKITLLNYPLDNT